MIYAQHFATADLRADITQDQQHCPCLWRRKLGSLMMSFSQTNEIQLLNPSQDFSFWKTYLPTVQFHRSLVGPRLSFKINEWHRWHCKGTLGGHNRNALLRVLLQQLQTLFMCPARKIIHIHHKGRPLTKRYCTLSAQNEAAAKQH